MELVVKAISKTGKNAGKGLLASDGKWYNAGKGVRDFTDLNPGDVIDAEVSDNFINAFGITGAKAKPAAKTTSTGGSFSSDRDGQISRGAAMKAVIESPYYNKHVEGMGVDEANAFLVTQAEMWAKYMREGK